MSIVLKNFFTSLDDQHNMLLISADKLSDKQFTFDYKLIEQTESKKSSNIIGTGLGVNPNNVLTDNCFL